MDEELVIREAVPEDCGVLLEMIRGFAFYMGFKEEDVTATEDLLRESIFGKHQAEVLIGEVDGEVAGYMLFYTSYSTFLARPSLFIEDLFIRERFRRTGLGEAFMNRIAAVARVRGCPRIEWCCLDDNIKAISFYLKNGARRLLGTGVYRLEGKALEQGAEE